MGLIDQMTRGQRYCTGCGEVVPKESRFCPNCGAATEGTSTARITTDTTKKEFRQRYADPRLYKELKILAIVGYVLAGFNAVGALLVDPWVLIDAALILGLTLGMHLGKSKVCAIILAIYGIIGEVTLVGIGMLIVGSDGARVIHKMDTQYKQELEQAKTAVPGEF